MRAWLMRCTQYVHFSMTPRLRIVTSGLRCAEQLRRREVRVEQEVEPPHLVRTVVRAVPRADAAVVDHVVQAFVVVLTSPPPGRPARTARPRTAAGHRLVVGLRRVEVALEVRVDANPVHLALRVDLLLADDRDVVLGHAGGDADAAAGAGVQVDRHAPLVAVVLRRREERERSRRLLGPELRDGLRIAPWYSSASTTRTGLRPSIAKWFCVEATR